MQQACVIGIDIGTSGVRSAVMNQHYQLIDASAQCTFAELDANRRSPSSWWQAVSMTLQATLERVSPAQVVALCIDGTSGTVLPIDAHGVPLATPMMYNDAVTDQRVLRAIAQVMPETSAAGGSTSGLAKALMFAETHPSHIVHQADWIVGRLTDKHGASDANNALKTGYDAVAGHWPEWIEHTGLNTHLLPEVHVPGTPITRISASVSNEFNLDPSVQVIAGTTDGCASFLATGADKVGDAVTALGSTLTLKMLSDKPVYAPAYGVYSHLVGHQWLVGGASNSGGKVLEQFFDQPALATLSAQIDTRVPLKLNYYPLPTVGERFPINDPALQPRMHPRPDDPILFLQALLEGMSGIEAMGYERLIDSGAPGLRSVRTVGGGARSKPWQLLRERALTEKFQTVTFNQTESSEAAAGTARLAAKGATQARLW